MQHPQRAFTLIELSIVLVIIGLIVGGVLVGRDLIRASEVRAQVTQIEKFNTAANTFRGKYNNYLPGDIPEPHASQFGFATRGAHPGMGDGNGILAGACCGAPAPGWAEGFYTTAGEVVMFWVDLSVAKLIDGSFTVASPSADAQGLVIQGSAIGRYIPQAKIGNTNYIYAWSGGFWSGVYTNYDGNGINYFGLSAVTDLGTGGNTRMSSNSGLSVQQAYIIDQKMDDGLPQSGKVMAWDLHINAGGNFSGASWRGAAPGISTAGSATTCYDNSANAAELMKYSLNQNNGRGINCALSFQMQ